ncbi:MULTISPECIES: hypothetical protein [Herbaspirillum]|jgi:hypothetical protein|uniref:hypothetical protein n=1 Tax=Herbaspirillum TaxID=963 RepID=UPI00258C245A|nr:MULTISPECIES: hypothetical protein [Herbaspirillum]MCP3653606.1 hypothetical protein [Herbaspirillum sp.]MCP3947396.1 hypothetical protein [Herbaspirillum sp.]MCP4034626.1 hypothetical protein [Herbaspirillum sp.]MCP4555217.1 hypothetical protein [Herbaspirillum sp.]MEE1638879.1 hypothetical protein [Herbaspirillum huttiense NC40101]
MKTEDFVSAWAREKDSFVQMFTNVDEECMVSTLLKSMELSPQQQEIFTKLMDTALSDVFYALLLGLDGAASIGGTQHTFSILGEGNLPIGASGEIEAVAWRHFHSS